MGHNGLTMFGCMTHRPIAGLSRIASALSQRHVKATLPPLSMTLCTFLEAAQRKGRIWEILPHFAYHHDAGIPFRIWDLRHRQDQATV